MTGQHSRSNVALHKLPHDILFAILSYLPVKGILNAGVTCKTLRAITKTRTVWLSVIRYQLLPCGISLPIPQTISVSTLSTDELRKHAIYAARLEHTWRNPNWDVRPPVLEWKPTSSHEQPHFIPGTGGQYLLTTSAKSFVGDYTFAVWYLGSCNDTPILKHEWVIEGTVLDIVFNSDASNAGCFAAVHEFAEDDYSIIVVGITFGDAVSHQTIWRLDQREGIQLLGLHGDLILTTASIMNYKTEAVACINRDETGIRSQNLSYALR
ncbi:hypothetical protein DL93DRAFT_816190 [Clavulina sp. PMI_390]|nr:hypothetical protein DL93DRAFT_816190 [Clavulina sp. PMI_390]